MIEPPNTNKNIVFILVKPAVPENVGAAARAINTMGFSALRLVNPCDHLCDKARMLAHGSHHILEEAAVFNSLKDALQDCDFRIGTTARRRNKFTNYIPVQGLTTYLERKEGTIQRIALVFGPEDRGLSNNDLAQCDIRTSIPLTQSYPSLNLGQAVMLFAWELTKNKSIPRHGIPTQLAEGEFLALKKRLIILLTKIGLDETTHRYDLLMDRIGMLGGKDIRLLHSICDLIEHRAAEKS